MYCIEFSISWNIHVFKFIILVCIIFSLSYPYWGPFFHCRIKYYHKIWGVTNRRNKQVPNGVVANVDYCIGDDVLNELDRIAKNIVDQCNNSEGGVGSVEE